jgi:hypothetical protein
MDYLVNRGHILITVDYWNVYLCKDFEIQRQYYKDKSGDLFTSTWQAVVRDSCNDQGKCLVEQILPQFQNRAIWWASARPTR